MTPSELQEKARLAEEQAETWRLEAARLHEKLACAHRALTEIVHHSDLLWPAQRAQQALDTAGDDSPLRERVLGRIAGLGYRISSDGDPWIKRPDVVSILVDELP